MDEDCVQAKELLGVFLDADRLRLIAALIDGERTITELSSSLGLKPQAAVRYVQMLEDFGLILRSGDRAAAVRLDVDALQRYALNMRPEPSDDFDGESDEDTRMLRSFLVDGRLARLPTQRSRWLVVLAWLVENFEHERRYPESEVNETLAPFHEDHALLRRQLVDERFMARDHGVYWRVEREDGT